MDKEKIGLNTASLAGFSLYEAIRKTKELGFSAIELLAFDGARHSLGDVAGFWFHELGPNGKKRLKKEVSNFKQVSIHAPFIDCPLFTCNKRIKEESIRQIKESIDATSFLGGKTATVHANPRIFFELKEYWKEALAIFRDLGRYAARQGVKIGIETGFPNTVKDYTNLIFDINHPAIGATIDTGHIVAYVANDIRGTSQGISEFNKILMEIVTILEDKIFHFHVHDVRSTDFRDHRTCGSGIIDFVGLFKHLKKTNYDGLFIFELEEEKKEEAIKKSKAYLDTLI